MYSYGKQRFFCKNCNKTFSQQNKSVKKANEFVWFTKWMGQGHSFEHLSELSKHSTRKIRYIVDYWLGQPIPQRIPVWKDIKYLVFDGSYIYKRKDSAVILMNACTNKLIMGTCLFKESNKQELTKWLLAMKQSGLEPVSVTVDGNRLVVNVFKSVWPHIIIQRCVVHIQRQGFMWCRAHPKTTQAKQLRVLFSRMNKVYSKKERNIFLNDVFVWEKQYGTYIETKQERGRVFSDVKRARSMLLKSLPYTFQHLNDPCIPKTSNLAESYFNKVKNRYRDHRGLSPKKRRSFFHWFFFLYP